MQIELKYFASVREALGLSTEILQVPRNVQSVGDLRAFLQGRGMQWASVLAPERALRTALNHEMCEADTLLVDGAEVAFFPPVTGG
jgi:molybdopterin synthase sulfur carrier subunit